MNLDLGLAGMIIILALFSVIGLIYIVVDETKKNNRMKNRNNK